ncbi:MAG: beta-glycosidase, partial [Bacteroidaceae bacterium]|nr:beta-glycosidase [Bacteroidaceae bacterium]
RPEVVVSNEGGQPVTRTLVGRIGDVEFRKTVTIRAGESHTVTFEPEEFPQLNLRNPRLWWPNGYGEPYLYPSTFSTLDGATPDAEPLRFQTGIRQVTWNTASDRLTLFVNGRRFVGRGGNWGFSEHNLLYRGREYDAAVRYHREMNFTMIRNWVGQTGDDEFYDACDRYGIMVWQDFWLANPCDGPDPDDEAMFRVNAEDMVSRIRRHPCLALYCGRNEGYPPATLDKALRRLVLDLHPGLPYIGSSADDVVSGHGPYWAITPRAYFELEAGADKFHSERGMPNVMAYESLVQTIGEADLVPLNTTEHPNAMYGLHDYTLNSAQGADSFNKLIETMFGTPKDAKQFAEWAQWINYNGYRAIFEGRSEHRRGMLLWMSHPAWPSMVWQTYDYYFDPTAAYFGCKKACEPLHIQWNPVREDIEVVNYHAGAQQGIKAVAQLLNQDGKEVWKNELAFDIEDDQTVACFPLALDKPTTDTYYIKLVLTDKNGKVLSDNFYVRGKKEDNYQSLLTLAKTTVNADLKTKQDGNQWIVEGTVKNDTNVPALMVRLQVKGQQTKERILPAFYNDNYFALMPGETKSIRITFAKQDSRGEQPFVELSGFNLK